MEDQEANPRQQLADDEIDLVDLLRTLWAWKGLIVVCTLVGMLGAGLFGYLQPTQYQAEALVAPTQDSGGSANLGGLGGLAGMAGIKVDGGANVVDRALALMRSRRVLQPLIEEKELLRYIFPDHWDAEAGQWQEEVWRVETRGEDKVELPHPLPRHGVKKLREAISHSEEDGGLKKISIVWHDYEVAAELVNMIIARINSVMREEEIQRLNRRLDHLREQVSETKISGVREALYNIMESNYKSKAVAQTEQEFVFSVIDPAIPEDVQVSGVGTKLYVALGTVLGGMLGVFGAFVGAFIRSNFIDNERSTATD